MTAGTIKTRMNGAYKWFALLSPFLVMFFVAFSKHESDINGLEIRAEVIEQSIFRELQAINRRLDRIGR